MQSDEQFLCTSSAIAVVMVGMRRVGSESDWKGCSGDKVHMSPSRVSGFNTFQVLCEHEHVTHAKGQCAF